MNILQIIAQDELRSGGGIQMWRLSTSLHRLGHTITMLYDINVDKNKYFPKLAKVGISLKFLPLRKLRFNVVTLKNIYFLRKFIQKNKFDVIHAHKGTAVDMVFLATLGMKIPIVSNRGVINPLNYFSAFKYRSKKLSRIIAVSQSVKDVMIKTGKINPRKIEVVYGSVDTNKYTSKVISTIRKELGISATAQLIGFAGNGGERKGLKYLLESFSIIKKKYPNSCLLLIGVTTKSLENFTIADDNKTSIYCAGFRTDMPNCMAGMDVFAFAGIKEEGLTGTVREAAAMSLPIITTNVAGNAELIHNHDNGLVVNIQDSEALAEGIIYLLENPNIAQSFGQKSRKFVEREMTNEVRAKKLETIYENVLTPMGENF